MQQVELFSELKKVEQHLEKIFKLTEKPAKNFFSNLRETKIEDRLVPHHDFLFIGLGDKIKCAIDPAGEPADLHRHALGQICKRVSLPLSFVDYLCSEQRTPWGNELAVINLNTLMKRTSFAPYGGEPMKFLVRSVGTTIRGVLSRRYALHLSTVPLIHHFTDYCKEQSAPILEVLSTDVRVQMLCAQPHVYQPFKGQFLAFGMAFLNSDYGAGTFSVYPFAFDPLRDLSTLFARYDLSSAIGEGLFRKIHLGPVLAERDLNVVRSDRAKKTDEVAALMRLSVQKYMSKEFTESICRAIARANESQVPWGRLRNSLMRVLLKDEVERVEKLLKERSSLLPKLDLSADGMPIPTAWWASQAVSYIAGTSTDPDRKIDLRQEAGSFITKEI